MQYGSIRLDGGAPAAPAASKGVFGGHGHRAAALALAALACIAFVGVVALERSTVQPTALCTDVECMLNSPTAPSQAPTAPRTLDPSEVERLQAALAEESGLEKSVTEDMNALEGEGKVQVNVIVSPQGAVGNRGPFGFPGARGETGEEGEAGAPGIRGGDGPQGVLGFQGIAGPAGSKGDPGKQGPPGPAGGGGSMGGAGPEGAMGGQGGEGPEGNVGPLPPPGPVGVQGPPGPAGLIGLSGKAGEVGPAAPAPAEIASIVINPMTGAPIAGVTVTVTRMVGGVERVLGTAESDRNGAVSMHVSPGEVTVRGHMEGFMDYSQFVVLLPRMVMSDRLLMPKTLPAGAAGIVLVWNPRIADMDIHMMTPWGCHVYWNNMRCKERGGVGEAQLDRDDLSGGGPEAMTIVTQIPGNFQVYVHKYSSGNIMDSEAKVYVFQADGRIFEFSLTNGDGKIEDGGTIWTVCDINGANGYVTAADVQRKVLQFNAAGGYAMTKELMAGLPEVQKLTVAMWVIDVAPTMPALASYAVGEEEQAFYLGNTKGITVCIMGECHATEVAVNDKAWHHVAFVFDSSVGTVLYIDGEEKWSGALGQGVSIATGGDLVLGMPQTAQGTMGPAAAGFVGEMSDVVIYRVAMTPTQVNILKTSHPMPGEQGLLVAYIMSQDEETPADKLLDLTPLHRDATLGGETPPVLIDPTNSLSFGTKPPNM